MVFDDKNIFSNNTFSEDADLSPLIFKLAWYTPVLLCTLYALYKVYYCCKHRRSQIMPVAIRALNTPPLSSPFYRQVRGNEPPHSDDHRGANRASSGTVRNLTTEFNTVPLGPDCHSQ